VCYTNDREITVPEVEGKTIRSMRLTLTGSSGESEVAIDFTDGPASPAQPVHASTSRRSSTLAGQANRKSSNDTVRFRTDSCPHYAGYNQQE
jgi:hypothetical protein